MRHHFQRHTLHDFNAAGGNIIHLAGIVTDELVDTLNLCGPAERIKERVQAWKASGASTLILGTMQVEALRAVAEAVL